MVVLEAIVRPISDAKLRAADLLALNEELRSFNMAKAQIHTLSIDSNPSGYSNV